MYASVSVLVYNHTFARHTVQARFPNKEARKVDYFTNAMVHDSTFAIKR